MEEKIIKIINNENISEEEILQVNQYLLENTFSGSDDLFYYCCKHDKIEMAKILFRDDHVKARGDIFKKRNSGFDIAITNANLDIAKWLNEIGHITIQSKLLKHIESCCKNNRKDIIEWLLNFQAIDAHKFLSENGKSLLYLLIKYDNVDIFTWLYTIIEEYVDDAKYKLCLHISSNKGSFDILKWLMNKKTPCGQFVVQLFTTSCKSPYTKLSVVKYLYGKIKLLRANGLDFNLDEKDNILFRISCRRGRLENLKWLYNQIYYPKNSPPFLAKKCEAFRLSCRYNDLEVSKWLYNLGSKYIHINDDEAFRLSCLKKNNETAKWLYSLGNINIHAKKNNAFENACSCGNLDTVKWLYTKGNINIRQDDDKFFRLASVSGNLKLVKWIFNQGEINIHAKEDEAFRYCCENNHLRIVYWLFKRGNININVREDEAFKSTCEFGYPRLLKWLYKNGNIDINQNNEEPFRILCENDHLDLAQWIYQREKIDITVLNDEVFRKCCQYNARKTADWLKTLNPNYNYHFDSTNKMIPVIKNNLENYLKNKNWEAIIKKTGLKKVENLDKDVCSICYEDSNLVTNCNHRYCISCIVRWTLKSNKCPYCNQHLDLKEAKVMITQLTE